MPGHGFLRSLILTAVLLAPVSSHAAVTPQHRRHNTAQKRVYDRTRKDYHIWDVHEDRAYRQYLRDQHRKYRNFSKLSRKQRATYWNWRHTHAGDR